MTGVGVGVRVGVAVAAGNEVEEAVATAVKASVAGNEAEVWAGLAQPTVINNTAGISME
jgi:hypothetical protein